MCVLHGKCVFYMTIMNIYDIYKRNLTVLLQLLLIYITCAALIFEHTFVLLSVERCIFTEKH